MSKTIGPGMAVPDVHVTLSGGEADAYAELRDASRVLEAAAKAYQAARERHQSAQGRLFRIWSPDAMPTERVG